VQEFRGKSEVTLW